MPRGDKSTYTDKQKRQANHIKQSEEAGGKPKKTAERIAWTTVNEQDGGGKKPSATATLSNEEELIYVHSSNATSPSACGRTVGSNNL